MTENGPAPEGMWSSPQDLVGTILADRYQVQKVIGDGGMGSVFLAEHVTLRKRVALKVLHPELCRDQTHVDRFLQEARAASMIQHENIVDIVDFGPVPGGSVFFAMEFLQGRDLADTLKQDGRMPWPRVQNFMLQIVRALHAAHDKGIIHRDLKPANCFVITKADGREFIKLLDFGIAKVTDAEHDKGLTRTGAVFGTAKYMAPEQACGETADGRTDIYAAAVLMYEILTGMVPFDGDNFMRVLSRHLTEPLTLPSTMAPDAGIPPMVESIVVKALSKKREDRYQTMKEFEQALLALGPDGTLLAGGMQAAAYAAPHTNPPTNGPASTLPLDDGKGNTMWMGQNAQANHGPPSQPPEGAGGTLLLDGDSVPPELLNGPDIKGPTGWSADTGGTMMLDGMGQDILPTGPAAAAITRNPPMMGGMQHPGTNPPPGPETRPPQQQSDPTYAGADPVTFDDSGNKKGMLAVLIGGGVAALALGGLAAFLLMGDDDAKAKETEKTPVVAKKDEPDEKEKPKREPEPLPLPGLDGGTPAADEGAAANADAADDEGDDDGLIIDDEPEPEPEPEPAPEPEPEPETKTTKPKPRTPKTPTGPVAHRTSKHLGKGFAKAAKAAKACGKKHGAIPGQSITVEAAIKASGGILSANAVGPSRTSPLGKCVAAAVKSKAKFVASKQALQTEKRTYKM